jgi:hypothetical protein
MPSKSKPKDLCASAEDTEGHKSIQNACKATFKEIDALRTSMRKLKGGARRDIARQIKKLS